MFAGRLNEIIRVQSLDTAVNEFGEMEELGYTDKFDIRAQVQYNNGTRTVENSDIFFPNNITFIIRIYHNINVLDRIQYNGNNYRIIAPPEKDRQYQLQKIHCELINV